MNLAEKVLVSLPAHQWDFRRACLLFSFFKECALTIQHSFGWTLIIRTNNIYIIIIRLITIPISRSPYIRVNKQTNKKWIIKWAEVLSLRLFIQRFGQLSNNSQFNREILTKRKPQKELKKGFPKTATKEKETLIYFSNCWNIRLFCASKTKVKTRKLSACFSRESRRSNISKHSLKHFLPSPATVKECYRGDHSKVQTHEATSNIEPAWKQRTMVFEHKSTKQKWK